MAKYTSYCTSNDIVLTFHNLNYGNDMLDSNT